MSSKIEIVAAAALAGAAVMFSSLWAMDSTAFEPRPDHPTQSVFEDVAWRAAAAMVHERHDEHRAQRALAHLATPVIHMPTTFIHARI